MLNSASNPWLFDGQGGHKVALTRMDDAEKVVRFDTHFKTARRTTSMYHDLLPPTPPPLSLHFVEVINQAHLMRFFRPPSLLSEEGATCMTDRPTDRPTPVCLAKTHSTRGREGYLPFDFFAPLRCKVITGSSGLIDSPLPLI